MKFEKRQYQEECIEIINNTSSGKYLIVMATGLGKTYIFSRIKRRGRMLILSHREELVIQPKKFFSCSFGLELNKVQSNGEEVVSASTLTLMANNRYQKFSPNEFDIIVIDEAHHAAAKSYRRLVEYFKPRLLLGFTATPNRGDGVRLDDIFSEIIYEKNIRWGIEHNYLSKVDCIRVSAGFDLRKVGSYMGDYKVSDLDKALRESDGVIVDAYYKYAKGATLIFTVSVEQAERIQKKIKNSVVVKASTKDREEIIDKLCKREIDCIINCMIFTEGTDIPLCETIIIARPTKSNALYSQMVGRGLRVYPGKEKLILIDVVGATVDNSLCTAPSLLGIDMKLLEKQKQDKIQGDLLSLPDMVLKESDCPASWVKSAEYVNLWAKENEYNLRDVNWIQLPDGSLSLRIPSNEKLNRYYSRDFKLETPDELGFTLLNGAKMKMQAALDMVYNLLKNCYSDCESIWNSQLAKKTWGMSKATGKQISFIKSSNEPLDGIDFDNLTKFEASLIINRIISENQRKNGTNHNKATWENKIDKKKHKETQKSKIHKPYRSVVSYLIWRYPKLNNEHAKKMLTMMYGRIPQDLLSDDAVYYSIIKTESDRINRYGSSSAFDFDNAEGVIAEFSKLSYYLAANHLKSHKALRCATALVIAIRHIYRELPYEQKEKLYDTVEAAVADFRCAGGDYQTISKRMSKLYNSLKQ